MADSSMATDSFADALGKVRQDDPSAFSEVHKRFWSKLVRFADEKMNHPLLRRAKDAESIAQSALLTVWKRIRDGRGSHEPESWEELRNLLMRVTERRVVRYFRKHVQGRDDAEVLTLDDLAELPDEDFESPQLRTELSEVLDGWFACLNEPQKTTIGLLMNGDDVEEIVESTELTRKSINRHIQIAQLALQDLLDQRT